MIRVEHDWWKTLFDEVYLMTDAPFVCNPALTKCEVDVIEEILRLQPAARILDVCGGQGRHALELARMGTYIFAPNVARWGWLPLAETSQTFEWLTADGQNSPQLQAHPL